ncbi:DUF6000 family protein [Streptomyces viridochromogenes]|uniref:Putative AviX4 n=1 Tax=Streptomyces viridochromogenes Tue57 TaxID=1160705 RepID=L8PF45_STRVR|nr:DUF6000 family protein [Streptomyces viridochromogenes]ELS56156.1 putative AviX4 [Streptomyces viridochromogenes Tue57]
MILHSRFWRVDADRTYGISGTGLDWELDWSAPWEHLVEESHTWSLLEASEAPVGGSIFVAPTWIDRTDLYPERWPMPFQHSEESGYGYVIERYVTSKDSDRPRCRDLKSGRVLRPGWPHAERFTRHLIDDAATITHAEWEALLGYEWRSRLTAAWLIGVGRRATFRERIGDLPPASEFCFSGGAHCFTLARFGTHADAEILTGTEPPDDPFQLVALALWTGPYCPIGR